MLSNMRWSKLPGWARILLVVVGMFVAGKLVTELVRYLLRMAVM